MERILINKRMKIIENIKTKKIKEIEKKTKSQKDSGKSCLWERKRKYMYKKNRPMTRNDKGRKRKKEARGMKMKIQ